MDSTILKQKPDNWPRHYGPCDAWALGWYFAVREWLSQDVGGKTRDRKPNATLRVAFAVLTHVKPDESAGGRRISTFTLEQLATDVGTNTRNARTHLRLLCTPGGPVEQVRAGRKGLAGAYALNYANGSGFTANPTPNNADVSGSDSQLWGSDSSYWGVGFEK